MIINAGVVMIQSARAGVGRFAEGVRARDFLEAIMSLVFYVYYKFAFT